VLEETQETEELIGRVAALDIGKTELVCCIRVPGQGKRGRRRKSAARNRAKAVQGAAARISLSAN
jgi:transposase